MNTDMNNQNINPRSARIHEIAKELTHLYSAPGSACIIIGVRDLGCELESLNLGTARGAGSVANLVKAASDCPELLAKLRMIVDMAEEFLIQKKRHHNNNHDSDEIIHQ